VQRFNSESDVNENAKYNIGNGFKQLFTHLQP
jgi:hypothetical protein